jgi:hypothetical protein
VDDPDAKVLWYKDGLEIKRSDIISSNKGEHFLTIREADPHDSGKYVCRIQGLSKNETFCDVLVIGKSQKLFFSSKILF